MTSSGFSVEFWLSRVCCGSHGILVLYLFLCSRSVPFVSVFLSLCLLYILSCLILFVDHLFLVFCVSGLGVYWRL